MQIVVNYPQPSAMDAHDLHVLMRFEALIVEKSAGLFLSTANPQWQLREGNHTSPIYCLLIEDETFYLEQ